MKNTALIVNTSGCTVVVGSKVTTLANDHPNFERVQQAYADGDVETMERLISISDSITNDSGGLIKIVDGQLYYGNRKMANALTKRIIHLISTGRDSFAEPLIAFLDNVMSNPSYRAVEGLYEWLERSKLPITPDGHFIAWKMVRDDFLDHYTGTMDNSPGQIVSISRNMVDEDPDRTCSSGLHFCSNEYLTSGYGHSGKIVMVKVNPKDVGAFPHDYNISKGRCCRYEVLQEVAPSYPEELAQENVGILTPENQASKIVDRIETRSLKDRAEIDLVFTDGSVQRTANRLGDTISFTQKGDVVTLHPSGRVITIK